MSHRAATSAATSGTAPGRCCRAQYSPPSASTTVTPPSAVAACSNRPADRQRPQHPLNAHYLAHALLAPLAADQRMVLRDEVTPERVKAGLATLVRSIFTGGRP